MNQPHYSETVEKARSYYNSDDADRFYYHVWGGEDIHVGMYLHPEEAIAQASRRTVEMMLASSRQLDRPLHILDIGGGYCGAARTIAGMTDHRMTVLNLSEAENIRGRALNAQQGFSDRIEVLDGNFEDIPCEQSTFDLVWSQDAILHSSRRERVFAEVDRVLKPRGEVIFTDPMRQNTTANESIRPILDRIHLESLASPSTYLDYAEQRNFTVAEFMDFSHMLPRHYQRVLETMRAREDELVAEIGISQAYIDNMKSGLGHWIEGGREGLLAWGIFYLRK